MRLEVRWPPSFTAPRARDRRPGQFRPYLPDLLLTSPLVVDAALGAKAALVERSVRSLGSGPAARTLEGLARFLLRSEAIASSASWAFRSVRSRSHWRSSPRWR